jgi:hypothetical protein
MMHGRRGKHFEDRGSTKAVSISKPPKSRITITDYLTFLIPRLIQNVTWEILQKVGLYMEKEPYEEALQH